MEFKMRITPLSELVNRCQKLQQLLVDHEMEAAFIVQNSDLFYFTGSVQKGVLLVPATGTPLYMVNKDSGRARMESGLEHVVKFNSLKEFAGILAQYGMGMPKKVGMELDVLPVLLMRRYQQLLDNAQIEDVTPLIRQVRACKSPYELEIMKDCALIADKTNEYAKTVIREGMTDLDLAAELECFARKEGHQGILRFRSFNSELYFGHIFSGSDGAVPTYLDTPLGGLGLTPAIPQGASYKKIAKGEPVVVDYVVAFDGYMVDQTRIMSIGPLPEDLQRAYFHMLDIQKKLYETAKPGVTWGEVYRQCAGLAAEQGYGDHFMGNKGGQVSFIGHGIGIEVDEYPFIARGFDNFTLQEGMTFAFEPKLVFPGQGAVGIENTWRVGSDGLKRLTYSNEDLCVL